MGVFGGWVKMCEFCGYFFWNLKVYKRKNTPGPSISHYWSCKLKFKLFFLLNFQRYCYYYFQKTTFPTEKRRALCNIIAFLCILDWRTKVTSNEHFLSMLRKSKTLYLWGFWSSDNFFEKRLPAPKVVYYRDYKNFFNDLFRNDILQAQALTDTKENVETNMINISNEHASLKEVICPCKSGTFHE